MRFNIVISSYLRDYPTAAKGREEKIVRSIGSVFAQSFADYEIIVVADGCDRTVEMMKDYDVRVL